MKENTNIGLYDFVRLRGDKAFMFVSEVTGDGKIVLVGMRLSDHKDTIMYYHMDAFVSEVTYVDECLLNMISPLVKLRDNLRNGIDNVYIE